MKYGSDFEAACAALAVVPVRGDKSPSVDDLSLARYIIQQVQRNPILAIQTVCNAALYWNDQALWRRSVESICRLLLDKDTLDIVRESQTVPNGIERFGFGTIKSR